MPILRIKRSKTSGTQDDIVQAFYQNEYVINSLSSVGSYAFDVPQYTTIGGTLDYYGQDPFATFTSINKPIFTFLFSANTHSMSGSTRLIHNIYKLKFDDYSQLGNGFTPVETKSKSEVSTITESENVIENGVLKTRQVTKTREEISETDDSFRASGLTRDDIWEILSSPRVSIEEAASGITSNIHYFYPEHIVKSDGNFSEELMEDKAQYFLNSYFKFTWDKGRNLMNQQTVFFTEDEDDYIVSSTTYEDDVFLSSATPAHVITGGTFSGCPVYGNFFVYMELPNKPKLEEPKVEGMLDTFTPIIYFSDVEDGDEFECQVSYDLADTGFTGTVYSYFFPKILNRDTQGNDQDIRKMIPTVRSNSEFRYRVGNIKKMTNVFGTKHFLTTYSDSCTAQTSSASVKSLVGTKIDSPHVTSVSVNTSPPSLDVESIETTYTLSGTVTSYAGEVNMATVQLIFPGGSMISTPTNSNGYFEFSNVASGTYTLKTIYWGHKVDTQTINITGDVHLTYNLVWLWGNEQGLLGEIGGTLGED